MAILEIRGNSMLSGREFGLIGLTIGFLGTLLMLWGGLESFIVVKPKGNLSKSDVSIIYDSGDPSTDPNYELVLTDIVGVNCHRKANQIGKGLLAGGFALQFFALLIDP